jgi:UDP-N-acetylglucosamine--N-acetylmuramyl-(pentapeptide) pyrophosphoryl-undecaprenol N-acetylglucosamine transferase
MSLGPAIACKLCGIPVLVHEANRRPGKAVRLIARFAQSVHLPHGVRIKNISTERQHDSGFPVRKEITSIARDIARHQLNFPSTGKMILVTGGSQGAQVLTRWVENNHDSFKKNHIHVLCLTGAGGREGEVSHAESIIRYLPFCNQMASAYSASDIAITRSGAGTLAELATCRTPAVLIPYAFAADDHQTANAVHAVEAGTAQMIAEKNIDKLNDTVFELLNQSSQLQAMNDALARADGNNHWDEILKEVLDLAQEGGSTK